jgi:hypothetical protein
MKLYRFRKIPLSIIRSLFTVHAAMVHVIKIFRQLSSRTRMELQFPILVLLEGCLGTCMTYIPLLSVQWINSWWWTEELSETFRVSCQNKFVKLVHLVCFIVKKQATVFGINVVWFPYLHAKHIHRLRMKSSLPKHSAHVNILSNQGESIRGDSPPYRLSGKGGVNHLLLGNKYVMKYCNEFLSCNNSCTYLCTEDFPSTYTAGLRCIL